MQDRQDKQKEKKKLIHIVLICLEHSSSINFGQ